MESLLITPVHLAQPHALPFRTICEEHRLRREADLLQSASTVFNVPLDQAGEALEKAIAAQEEAYRRLSEEDGKIMTGSRTTPLDELLTTCAEKDNPLKQVLHLMNASAVALSGGGIRSASFSLGVLEGLSRYSRPDGPGTPSPAANLMDNLDYLSTVSGGGYIGSWMMSWVYRRWMILPEPAAGGPSRWRTAYGQVISALAGHPPLSGADPEPQTVRHLRTYTSFLAPDLGLTVDSSTLAAIVLRNLILNWAMIVPVLLFAVSLAKVSGFALLRTQNALESAPNTFLEKLILIFFFAAALMAAFALPSHRKKFGNRWFRQYAPLIFVSFVVLGSWFLVVSWHLHAEYGATTLFYLSVVNFAVVGFSIFLAYKDRVAERNLSFGRAKAMPLFMALLAVVVISAMTSGLISLLQAYVCPNLFKFHAHSDFVIFHEHLHRLFIIFGLPFIITILTIASSFFCALLGVFEMEEDREWWARAGGCFLLFNLFWIFAHAIAFYGAQGWHGILTGATGLAVGLGGSLVGYSGVTSAGPRPVKSEQLGSIGRFLQKHDLVLPAIGASSLTLIALGATAIEEGLRTAILDPTSASGTFSYIDRFNAAHAYAGDLWSAATILAAAFVLGILINFAININLFSLHGMYRMRLMRTFLGASNVVRRPDPFTNFDPKDTPHEIDLPHDPGAPLHLINATLNLTGTKNTAWRQRRAECFTFSPVHAGSWRLGYVPASIYGGGRGVTLATAMSISGAAFNPNMGYQSSSLLSLLMTFFNLRLGFWLPNPGRQHSDTFFHKGGPVFALKPILSEAFGLADDTSDWVELTDGGHFENLGLYEMIVRRVKRIIVVDAGADPKCQFEDLGNAIRKISIDLGVPIRFCDDNIKMKAGMENKNYCAVATIDYGCVDPLLPKQAPPGPANSHDARTGVLIYIKASVTGSEPADILQYAKTHETFPHETTANQFFNESQFESYRHLGSYIVERIAETAPTGPFFTQFDEFAGAAHEHWKKA